MTPADILPGHTYAGKGADAHRLRRVESIEGGHAVTRVYSAVGADLGESVLYLSVLAQWADRDVTPEGEPVQTRTEPTPQQQSLFDTEEVA